jgi:cupin fold WbuC family metalloprotein
MSTSPTALSAVTGDVFHLDDELLTAGIEAAHKSPRRRIILPIHRTQDALVQRMFNFMLPGTYVQPHLHPREGAIETMMVLRGALGFVLFDNVGNVRDHWRLSAGTPSAVLDIEPQLWHGMVILEPDTVILEIKRGPYTLEHDKIFADWAPAEGDNDADDYREKLEALFA